MFMMEQFNQTADSLCQSLSPMADDETLVPMLEAFNNVTIDVIGKVGKRTSVCIGVCKSVARIFSMGGGGGHKFLFVHVVRIIKGPLSYKYILTSVDVYESIHHQIITSLLDFNVYHIFLNNISFIFLYCTKPRIF